MANLIKSIGYSLGKLHTGMIAHLCELHSEGVTRPLHDFFERLGVATPKNPAAKREWRAVDLAIFAGKPKDFEKPAILLEMKVDDYDHETTKWVDGKKKRDYQTVLYAEMFPGCDAYLYVTLGMGEYFHPPYGQNFRWIRLREFLAAVDAIRDKDQPIKDWAEAIRNEQCLQDAVLRGDRSRMNEYRSGAWNIYFLGHLKEQFEQRSGGFTGVAAPTCYTYGTAPDTILHFGPIRGYAAYMEINNNGRLNLKIRLEVYTGNEDKQRAIDALLEHVKTAGRTAEQNGDLSIHTGGRIGASKTIASFDVRLVRCAGDGALAFAVSNEETVERLQQVIEPFYCE